MHNGSGSASWFMEGLSLHAVGMGRIRIGNREWAQHKQNASTEASPVVAVAPKFEPSSFRRKGCFIHIRVVVFFQILQPVQHGEIMVKGKTLIICERATIKCNLPAIFNLNLRNACRLRSEVEHYHQKSER